MYTGMLHLHSFGRWVVLILLLLAIFRHLGAKNRPYTKADARTSLFLMIASDIMLLVGIYLYVAGPRGVQLIQNKGGMAGVMGDAVSRFFAVEHLIGMILAIALIHIGKAQGKKNLTDPARHRRTAIFYIIALLIILVSIPWPFREVGAGRGWY